MQKCYLVICRDDTTPEGEKGEYVFATHRFFKDKQSAQVWMIGINAAREPLIIEMEASEILSFCASTLENERATKGAHKMTGQRKDITSLRK